MTADLYPLQVLLVTLAGWVNRHQQQVIEYLAEENRVFKEQLKGRHVRLTDDQRRRLAAKLLATRWSLGPVIFQHLGAAACARRDASNTSTMAPRGAAMPRTRVEPRFSLEYLSILDADGILDAALGPRPPNDRLQRLRARRALGPALDLEDHRRMSAVRRRRR